MAQWRGAETAAACDHGDPRALVRRRCPSLDGMVWHTVCANCATVAGRCAVTLEELRRSAPDGG